METARSCNEYGAELARQYPGKLVPLASLPLPEIEESIREIRYCREALDIHGFALPTNHLGAYLGSELLEPVMEELNRGPTLVTIHPTLPRQQLAGAAEELPGPVMEYFFETTRAVVNLMLKGTLRRYPNVRFVLPHGGAFMTIISDIAGDLARLYYDLAGFSMSKQFDLLRTMTEDCHLLYESDGPFTFLPVCVRQAEQMDQKLGDSLDEQIYQRNPNTLFKEVGLLQ